MIKNSIGICINVTKQFFLDYLVQLVRKYVQFDIAHAFHIQF
jgi:hypothetical protein